MTMHMGDVIRRLREQAGMSMGQLSRAAGVDLASLSRIEAHKQHLLIPENMARVAQALGTTAEDMKAMAGDNSVPPPGWPSLEELLARDPNLTQRQRDAIQAVYEGFVRR